MGCPEEASENRCTWCQTDALIAECASSPPLEAAVQAYCRQAGLTEWFAVCGHLAGQCLRCRRVVLSICAKALRACRYPPREWTAEDVGQTLFFRILRTRWQVKRGPLGGWLAVIARNLARDAAKSAYAGRTRPAGDLADEDDEDPIERLVPGGIGPDPADVAEQRDLVDRLRRAVEALPLERRQLVTLRFLRGYKLQEIADELRTPLATVARHLRRALDELGGMLDDGDGPDSPVQPGGKP